MKNKTFNQVLPDQLPGLLKNLFQVHQHDHYSYFTKIV